MFKPLSENLDSVINPKAEPRAMPEGAVNNVFKVMHGFYGNLFLSKFATGDVDDAGQDRGIVSARQIWGHGLRGFGPNTVKSALARCMTHHPEFPPSLPQFVALCEACTPRKTYAQTVKADGRAIPMSAELRSAYSRRVRESNLSRAAVALAGRTGFKEIPDGLQGLKHAIADAVAAAGGDEAAELLRLDRLFARTPA